MDEIKGLWCVCVTNATLSSLLLQPVLSLHSLLEEVCLFMDIASLQMPLSSSLRLGIWFENGALQPRLFLLAKSRGYCVRDEHERAEVCARFQRREADE